MKRLLGVAMGLVLLVPAPAWANHEGNSGGDYGGNEREEEYGDGSCKYFCPAFDRSPVQDSFNPTICVLPDSCKFEGGEKK